MDKDIYKIGRGGTKKIVDVGKDKVSPSINRQTKRKEIPTNPHYERFENPMQAIYEAAVRAMKNIKVFPQDPKLEPFYVKPEMQDSDDGYVDFFKTVRIDTGEFGRVLKDINSESSEVSFPAVFIHFINIRYLVDQQRIGEGRATMRIRFVLNNFNNTDPVVETMPFRVSQLINRSIQYAKKYEPSFDERVNLTFIDMPERANNLQPYWIDYEVWFRDMSSWVYQDYKKVQVVVPPFTNHSDYPEGNIHDHDDHKKPTYDDVVTII